MTNTASCSKWTYHAHSFVHVTVAEDNERGFSSELQRNFLHVTDCAALDGGEPEIHEDEL